MIRVKIFNGLGNQLFQYACGRAIQEKYGGDLYLDISDFKTNKRSFRLDKFKLNENINFLNKDNTFSNIRKNKLLNVIYKIIPNTSFKIQSKFGKYLYFGEEYKEIENNFTNNYYLYGYWQSEKYFSNIKDKIKSEIQLRDELSSDIKLINEIEKCNSVAIHVRRGDYLTNKLYKDICDKDYYKNAINVIKEKIEKPIFFIFSDDCKWVEENWFLDENVFFVNDNYEDYEELIIMSKCKHFIIANSSFSWWGQYLSENSNKIVVAPKRWYNNDKKVDIFMNEWIKI